MALICERCGKKVMRGHNVSHAKNRTNRVWRPNLQVARVMVDGPSAGSGRGVRRRVMLCTRCVKVLNRARKALKVAPRKDFSASSPAKPDSDSENPLGKQAVEVTKEKTDKKAAKKEKKGTEKKVAKGKTSEK